MYFYLATFVGNPSPEGSPAGHQQHQSGNSSLLGQRCQCTEKWWTDGKFTHFRRLSQKRDKMRVIILTMQAQCF